MKINRIPGDAEDKWQQFVQRWNTPEARQEREQSIQQHEAAKAELESFLTGDRW